MIERLNVVMSAAGIATPSRHCHRKFHFTITKYSNAKNDLVVARSIQTFLNLVIG